MAGIAALKENAYVEKGRKTIFEEAPCLKKGLEELGFTVYPSEANYIFFQGRARIDLKRNPKRSDHRDCSNYPGLTEGFYRVAVRTHQENERLLEALKKGLEGE